MSSTAFGFRARGVIASLAFACLLISCNKNSPITLPVKDKTIVFYIVADNDLRYQADCLISDFENLIQKESLNSTYLILLLDLKEDSPLESRLVSICESYRNRYEKEDIISPISLLNVDKLWKLLKSLESIDHIPSSIDLERVLASTRWNSITNWLTKWDITNQISITNKSRD